ncbi:hypothetical protein EIN_124130 [Entamoeba invadens IP1]|uniref:Uncharacterized protein n=1 Tax=Entamoeba invadens IP1 TaxID=370355 RepID=L7FK62_ENTIV|nr:hypothetical protein EIN_124130 [Entamoeba invadens IP1]ELP86041.1 hypothetical protein EIN_124130 [Entamoeba invadens IP1]|eukprot:XP_004185387.1 hypothetical protein EIN_124130 [Entamoeba invadens IP1]
MNMNYRTSIIYDTKDVICPLVLGKVHCGRSALVYQFCLNKYYANIDLLDNKMFFKKVLLDRNVIPVQIYDIRTEQDYDSFDYTTILKSDGFIIVYSITSISSFKYTESVYSAVQRKLYLTEEPFPIILCVTKSDLENERVVSQEEGEKLASKWGVPFFEVSAKNNVNVTECFLTLINGVVECKKTGEKHPQKIDKEKKKKTCEIV